MCRYFIISEISRTASAVEVDSVEATVTISATFQIINVKILVKLSTKNNIKVLQHLKQRFRRALSRNK